MKMACQIIHSWTFSGLVGAFLDLAIAYLLLIAAAVAYFTSRFLDFLGLSLPCPCDGLFGNPKNNYCIHRHLVDGPSEKTGTVQFQLKSKFPFDSLWTEDPHFHSKSKPVKELKHDDAHFEFEGEALCSSLSDGKWLDVVGRDSVSGNEQSIESGAVNLESGKEKCFDHKGKKIASRRPSNSFRRRAASVDCGKLFSVSSCDMAQSDSHDIATPPYIINKMGNDDSEFTTNQGRRSPTLHRLRKGSSIDYGKLCPVSTYDMLQSDGRYIPTPPASTSKIGNEVTEVPSSSGDCTEAPTDTGVPERVLLLELNNCVGESTPIEDDASSVEYFRYNTQEKLVYDSNDKTTVRVLEQVLDEEHAARNALYYELEKERSAAATAADEAMAMILRLQEEKASIEMESRQYHRMIEEKSAYDAEEMNILKEILVRREREKHFLEKEVEYYRQMLFGDQGDVEMHDVSTTQASISLHSSEEMVLRQEHTRDSMTEKPKELPGSDLEYDTDSSNHLLGGNNSKHEINHDFQEKGMVSTVEIPVSRGQEVQVMNPEGLNLHDETRSAFNSEPCVHDVHVIEDDSHTCDEMSGDKSEQLPKSAPLDISEKHNTTARLGTERKIHRASSDTARESPRMNSSQVKFLLHNVRRNSMSAVDLEKWNTENKVHRACSDTEAKDMRRNSMTALDYERWKKGRNIDRSSSDPSPSPSAMRRNSMSAVDHERWKIDNEVEWLRERLRIVQEGREKLNFSVGHSQRGKIQRKLLEDITSQLREIRQLTEPGKAECQASLPPPSAKIMSKKRRWRTLSLGVHRST